MRDTIKAYSRCCLLLLLAANISSVLGASQNPASAPEIRNPWMDQHERIDARLKRGPSEILFIGDSITYNWASNSRGKPVWDQYYGHLDVVNMGISGDKTENILWRLQHSSLEEVKPKVAVVLAGINNIHRDRPEQIAEGVEAIVNEILTRAPSCQVLLMGLFPRGYQASAPERPNIKAVNAMLKSLDARPRVVFLDISEEFLDQNGVYPRDMSPDALHPLAKGYEIWANAMNPILERMLATASR